jgi:hypothetical protein
VKGGKCEKDEKEEKEEKGTKDSRMHARKLFLGHGS